tara:strand:- start:559 stop:1479 length:921 start_codon:yes stop_codon:yes gene_type:complete
MNLTPINQINLYGLENKLDDLYYLFKQNRLPNKILLSGQKGCGKATMAFHLINRILSENEEYSYNVKNYQINNKNRSFRLIQNFTNPNFHLVDILPDKKIIDINQIRSLILDLNKSSFNSKPRFVLIDNIEFLNLSSVNALLKILEEPNDNIYFILINNGKKILDTLKSRCLDFKISFSNAKSIEISNKLLEKNLFELINKNLINYYFTPGNVLNLIKFANENSLDLKDIDLKNFLIILINKCYYKKETIIKYLIYDFLELFIRNCSDYIYSNKYNYFLKRIHELKKYNLDDESFFIEFETKILNV